MNIGLLESNHDAVTAAVHRARKAELGFLESGNVVEKLFGSQATADQLQQAWRRITGYFDLISAMGHGSDTSFHGHNDQVIFNNSSSHSAVKSAVIHLFSCNTANQLGKFLIGSGAKAFVGYRDFVSLPNDDSLTTFFIQEAVAIDRALSERKSTQDVKHAADAAYNSARARLELSPATEAEDLAAFDLNHNALVGPWTDPGYGTA